MMLSGNILNRLKEWKVRRKAEYVGICRITSIGKEDISFDRQMTVHVEISGVSAYKEPAYGSGKKLKEAESDSAPGQYVCDLLYSRGMAEKNLTFAVSDGNDELLLIAEIPCSME